MLSLIFSIIALDINKYIDGINDMKHEVNNKSQYIEIQVPNNNYILYYQQFDDIEIYNIKNDNKTKIKTNGYQIPHNSTLYIKAKWEKYDNYIIGLFHSEDCEFIYYTNAVYDSLPLIIYLGKNLCIYHLSNSSAITIGNKKYSKIARIVGNEETAFINSWNMNTNEKIDKLEIHIQRKQNILNDEFFGNPNFSKKKNKFTYAVGYTCLCLGLIFYILVGIFSSENECFDITKFVDLDNRDNGFYTKTLKEFK